MAATAFGLFFCLGIGLVRAEESRKVITCLGDSVTHGYPYADSLDTYPAKLQTSLDSQYGVDKYEVINRGADGYRADEVLSHLQSDGWLSADNPDAVLLMIGGNDLAQGQSISSTVSEVQQIVDYIKAHKNADGSTPQVILSAFIPNLLYGTGGSAYVNLYNNTLAASISKLDLWTTDNWTDFYNSGTGQARTELMKDDAHPNIDGYAVMAENWLAAVNLKITPPGGGDDGGGTTNPAGLEINPKIIASSGPGQISRLQVYSRQGYPVTTQIKNLFPDNYLGGAGVAAIDSDRVGVRQQLVVFAQSSAGPQARVIGINEDGGTVLRGQMFLFDKSIRDGLSVTVGDFDNDGFDNDLAACLTGNRAPIVRVYKNTKGMDNWQKIGEFKAPFGAVGCNVGTFQYDDKADEILVAPNHGPALPKVYIYTVGGTKKSEFTAYGAGVTNGLSVSGINDRIYTTPNSGTSHVMVFDRNGNRKNFWWAYAQNVKGNFLNVAGDIDLDSKDEILISPIGSNGPQVVSFEPDGRTRTFPNFFAFGDKTLRNGASVAVIDNWHGKN